MDRSTRKVLLIEDDPKSRFALQSVLEHHGHEVIACQDADGARQLDHQPFDMAIIDVRLPSELGTAFAAELKARSPDTRIVFITAYDDIDHAGPPVAGAIILIKPIDMDALLRLL